MTERSRVLYIHDAVVAFREATSVFASKATAQTYASALQALLRPYAHRALGTLSADDIDNAFATYGATRSVKRFNAARAAWAVFRGWAAETLGLDLPPGRPLIERWSRTKADKPAAAAYTTPVKLTQRDLDDIRGVLASGKRRLRLDDAIVLRWDGMKEETMAGVRYLMLTRSAGDPLAFSRGTAFDTLRARWERLGSPETGYVFPRAPGVNEPIPLAVLSVLLQDQLQVAGG